jgi:proteic killer suppression protein
MLYVTRISVVRMILGYRDERTAAFANRESVAAFRGIEQQAWKGLRILGAASSLNVPRALRSSRLEALKGDRQGQYSIRINDQWRICFRWPRGSPGPTDMEIVDYH